MIQNPASAVFTRYREICFAVLSLLVSLGAVADDTQAESPGGPVPAQIRPLAVESLLLDITRAPSGRFVAVGERGHIVLSDDGIEWLQATSVPLRSTLTSITSAEGKLWAAGHDSAILLSEDDGQTWSILNYDPDRLQPILDIRFSDLQNGIAIGAYGLALLTSDGGETWEDVMISEDEWHLNGLLDLGDGTMMIAGEAGFSYRSTDGGMHWETIEMPYPGSMFGISRSAKGCVMVFGLRGHAQESCDLGASWKELETGTEASLGGGFSSKRSFLLVGNSGEILQRDSQGRFVSSVHSSGVDFSAAVSLDDERFLLVGEEGIHLFPEPVDQVPGS